VTLALEGRDRRLGLGRIVAAVAGVGAFAGSMLGQAFEPNR
jgi:hypothetical protein